MVTVAPPASRALERSAQSLPARMEPAALPPGAESTATEVPPPAAPPIRLAVLLAFILICVALLTWRLFYWQVLQHEWLKQQASSEQVREQVLPPQSGMVYDARGHILAASVAADFVSADPSAVADPGLTAERLSPIIGVPAAKLRAKLTESTGSYVRLSGKVDDRVRRQVLALQLPGIQLEPTTQRVYPEGTLAAHLLGFADGEGQAWYGLEDYYRSTITGRPGRIRAEMDTAGTEIGFGLRERAAPLDGYDLILTIDRTIQHFAERELEQALERHEAESGTIIVLDVTTGAIIAMASYPTFNPNHYDRFQAGLFRNPAISMPFEPGSTFKLVTVAAAIDLGLINPHTTYTDTGAVTIGPHTIHNWDGRSYGHTTVTALLQKSLNTGAIWIAQLLGPQRFYRYVTAFGFGRRTGVDLQGETPGRFRNSAASGWTPSDLATNSFGQGITATPLQLISAIAGLANHGQRMRPYVVQARVNPKTEEVVATTVPAVAEQVVKPSTARTMLQLMEAVARQGETSYAFVPGYRVGGKTGTASIPTSDGYDPELTIASYVGVAPIDVPRFAILVKIDQPKSVPWGSVVAAPTFRNIAEALMVYYRIAPSDPAGRQAAQRAAALKRQATPSPVPSDEGARNDG